MPMRAFRGSFRGFGRLGKTHLFEALSGAPFRCSVEEFPARVVLSSALYHCGESVCERQSSTDDVSFATMNRSVALLEIDRVRVRIPVK